MRFCGLYGIASLSPKLRLVTCNSSLPGTHWLCAATMIFINLHGADHKPTAWEHTGFQSVSL